MRNIDEGLAMTTRSFYRDYMLSCQPMQLDNGRYQARVAITSMHPNKTCAQRFLDLESFDSREDAVERSRQAGMDWVNANG